MVQGFFVKDMPLIPVVLAWGERAQNPVVVLDTGFTGDIQVTPEIAKELGLRIAGLTRSKIADGQIVEIPTALAVAMMEGTLKSIQVLISESMPLAGISFLTKFGYKAIVDCKYRAITLERLV